MRVGTGADQLTVGGHHIDREHALAGPSPRAAVPPLAALEEVAAQPDGRAVPAREEVTL